MISEWDDSVEAFLPYNLDVLISVSYAVQILGWNLELSACLQHSSYTMDSVKLLFKFKWPRKLLAPHPKHMFDLRYWFCISFVNLVYWFNTGVLNCLFLLNSLEKSKNALFVLWIWIYLWPKKFALWTTLIKMYSIPRIHTAISLSVAIFKSFYDRTCLISSKGMSEYDYICCAFLTLF